MVAPAGAENRALLIGIDRYEHAVIKPLDGPKRDVNNMRWLATELSGFKEGEIKVLRNEQATRDGILGAIDAWLIEGTSAGDEVLLYYSGHGFWQEDDDSDEEDGKDETIVPYDTTVSEGRYVGMISDDELQRAALSLAGRAATFIFDSCHSGTITRSLGSMDGHPAAKTLSPLAPAPATRALSKSMIEAHRGEEALVKGGAGSVVWTAVSSYQLAFTDVENGEGSLFTNRFLAGLRDRRADANADGRVSNSEMLSFVRRESDSFCRRQPTICKAGLTPTLEGSKDLLAEDVLARKAEPAGALQRIGAALPSARQASGTIALSIHPGPRLRIGDELVISVQTKSPGQLVLMDADASGELTQLFPNRFSREEGRGNRVEAGAAVTIPDASWGFELRATPPSGRGKIVAIVVEDDVDLSAITETGKDLQTMESSDRYVDGLAEVIQQVWRGDALDRPVKWSKAEVDYEIQN